MKENYTWVLRCIRSCKTPWQLRSAHRLVELFRDAFGHEETRELHDKLLDAILEEQANLSVDA